MCAKQTTESYRFVHLKGQVIKNGKVSYPHQLTLCLERNEAFKYALDILNRIESQRPADVDQLLEIPWLSGQLELEED